MIDAGRVEYLAWDSDLFGEKIGRVSIGGSADIEGCITEARQTGYRLVYVFADNGVAIDESVMKRLNGHLADRKLLYVKTVEKIKDVPLFVSEYDSDELSPELLQLAYESGRYSRFNIDKNFRDGGFYRMYKIWMEKSVKRQIANHVFVVKDDALSVKGMVTLKICDGEGHIGLIAVFSDAQGKGYGRALVSVCENRLADGGIAKLNVFTQGGNIQACKFYERCGFKIEKTTNIYHFWIR